MMHRYRTRTLRVFIPVASILAAVLLNGILLARADSSARSDLAESYISGFFRTTAETAVAPQSDEYATKAVKVLLLREIQLDETARFMLGRAWPSDNKEAGRRFQDQFEDFVAEVVTKALRTNPKLALQVKASRARPDGTILVTSSLALPSGTAVPVDWRVTQNPETGTFQIVDISVVGIDAATMLRSMAEATLAETDIDGLIPHWRATLVRRTVAEHPTVTSP